MCVISSNSVSSTKDPGHTAGSLESDNLSGTAIGSSLPTKSDAPAEQTPPAKQTPPPAEQPTLGSSPAPPPGAPSDDDFLLCPIGLAML